MKANANASNPRILTTTLGSYPMIDWLAAYPSEQGVLDATRVIVDIQRQAGIDMPTDGELYRFDVNHPDTNGMIEYFVRPLGGVRAQVGLADSKAFAKKSEMGFRQKPAAVVEEAITGGALNLYDQAERACSVAGRNLRFTLTSPYMLARTLLDNHYKNFEDLLMALAEVLAEQVGEINTRCVQIDEANITGNPDDAEMAARAINVVLDKVRGERAVHFCFGNYGGQTIQTGNWKKLVKFLNALKCDHLTLELQHRPPEDLEALKDIDDRIALGIGVIDVKINRIETPDKIAASIERAEKVLGEGRVKWVHPDCGFWMNKRSIADRKIRALVQGRDKYLGLR